MPGSRSLVMETVPGPRIWVNVEPFETMMLDPDPSAFWIDIRIDGRPWVAHRFHLDSRGRRIDV